MVVRSPHRDALRILYILVNGCDVADDGHTRSFRGEAKLHAYDFWFRNPDYLADELLDLYEKDGEEKYLLEVERIFRDSEPDIRRFPMIRYRFGAYEPLDDTLALLKSRDLIRITGSGAGGKVQQWEFLVMPTAFQLAKTIVADYPTLEWYARRGALIAEVAAGRRGSALKKRQYEQADYAETEMGSIIPPIKNRVAKRLASLRQEA